MKKMNNGNTGFPKLRIQRKIAFLRENAKKIARDACASDVRCVFCNRVVGESGRRSRLFPASG